MRENRFVTVTIDGMMHEERTLEVQWREKIRKKRWR